MYCEEQRQGKGDCSEDYFHCQYVSKYFLGFFLVPGDFPDCKVHHSSIKNLTISSCPTLPVSS
ncbi:MAG: hypothetical protein AAB271_03045, partial [Nitrospirota bacterium]